VPAPADFAPGWLDVFASACSSSASGINQNPGIDRSATTKPSGVGWIIKFLRRHPDGRRTFRIAIALADAPLIGGAAT